MPEPFKRRQLLLRREDGEAAGFVRVEQEGARCAVEIRAEGVIGDARAVLLRPGGGEPCALGAVRKGKGSYSLRAEEVEGYTQAAVLAGDRLLLIGGEGADFPEMRRRMLAQPSGARRVAAQPVVRTGDAEYADFTAERAPESDAWAVPARERPAARREERPAWRAEETRDGWVFTPLYAKNAPERITGRFLRDGCVVATLQGVAGVYAPEPPPGLTGFVWDTGYWVKVEGE